MLVRRDSRGFLQGRGKKRETRLRRDKDGMMVVVRRTKGTDYANATRRMEMWVCVKRARIEPWQNRIIPLENVMSLDGVRRRH